MSRPTEYHWIGLRDGEPPTTGTQPIEDFITIRDDCIGILESSGALWNVREIHILDANGQLVWSKVRT